MSQLTNTLWELGFKGWSGETSWQDGYSVLLPVPHDLPVFFKLAMQTVQRQSADHRVDILVIPDTPTAKFRQVYEAVYASLPKALRQEMSLVEMSAKDRFFRRIGSRKEHYLQTVNGIMRAKGQQVLMHDADAFILSDTFFDRMYQDCVERKLSVLGVNPIWDDWYRDRNYDHLVATWEMMCSQQWARRFAPSAFRGHVNTLPNEAPHSFDNYCYAQCQTAPQEIGLFEGEVEFVHFNHVIRTYRLFSQAKANNETYVDEHFRLVLIRLLVELFDQESAADYDLPTMGDLYQSLVGQNDAVSFISEDSEHEYRKFRTKLNQLLGSVYLNDAQRDEVAAMLQPFDQHFLAPVGTPAAPVVAMADMVSTETVNADAVLEAVGSTKA